jgi:hypothetical protein
MIDTFYDFVSHKHNEDDSPQSEMGLQLQT